MKILKMRFAGVPFAALAAMTLLGVGVAVAAESERKASSRGGDVEVREVELFAAMEAGEIEVTLFAKDAKQGNVVIKNKTDKPLRIALPEAFAGVPALNQAFGAGGLGGGLAGGGLGAGGLGAGGLGGGLGALQGLGGGFGGGLGGFGGGGFGGGGFGGLGGGGFGGGGFFNVGPEKTGKIKVTTVCLEHGKEDPNVRVPYTLVPLKSFKDDPQVYEICAMLGRGEIDQASAQAAAWHVTDKLSFEELAAKIGIKHLNGTTEPFFLPQQVARAMHIVREAGRRAELRSIAAKSSRTDSLSQN